MVDGLVAEKKQIDANVKKLKKQVNSDKELKARYKEFIKVGLNFITEEELSGITIWLNSQGSCRDCLWPFS